MFKKIEVPSHRPGVRRFLVKCLIATKSPKEVALDKMLADAPNYYTGKSSQLVASKKQPPRTNGAGSPTHHLF